MGKKRNRERTEKKRRTNIREQRKRRKIREQRKQIYENNTDKILELAHAANTDINVRTINVIDFVIRKVEEITGEELTPYWQTYKTKYPSGGRRRRFRTKKRKTKKYKKISKRNRKI